MKFLIELIRLAPEHTDAFTANASAYKSKISTLDQTIKDEFASVEKQNFIVFHEAYNYFLEAYDLGEYQIASLQEFPGDEPSAQYLAGIVDSVENEDANIIFTEPQFSPKVVQTLQQEFPDLVVYELDPLGGTLAVDGYERFIVATYCSIYECFSE